MFSQRMTFCGESSPPPGDRLLRRVAMAALVCTAAVWSLGATRSASAAVLQSMSLYSQVQVNFEGATSDLLDEMVSGAFDESLSVSVPSPESNGEASADSYLTGSALDHALTLSGGGFIGNFEAAGGSSAISRVGATAVYVIDAPTPFTLQMPNGSLAGGPGSFGTNSFSLDDANGDAVAVVAPGIGDTTARFGMISSDSEFNNGEGSYAAGMVLSGTLEPGIYTLRYNGEVYGSGFGGVSLTNLVLTVPEPSTAAVLGLGGVLLACRRRRSN